MDRNDYMDGIDTKIYNNYIGVNVAGLIDLHNYDFSTYNIYNNEIGANVIDDYYVIITHVYFYLSGTYQDEIGVYVNGISNGNYVEVDDCRIERFEIGIFIIGNGDLGNDLSNNEINDCSIGIYVENGDEDSIGGNEISGCGCGIYLDTCDSMFLIGNTLYDNNADGGIRCGIYSLSGTYIFLQYNTITKHYRGVWFDQQGGIVNDNIINDDGGIDSDEWGGDDVEIGVYITNSDNGVGICRNHFEDLGYGIGVVATDDISIDGEGEDMVDIEYKCLYATCDANHGSSGYIYGYGIEENYYYVYLKGISTDYTDFLYDDLDGTWDCEDGGGSYSTWTELE
jgi:parallel beta-helix repeat protein